MIAFGTAQAQAILEFDRMTRLLEEEALDNHKKSGWVEPAVEDLLTDFCAGVTKAQRKQTLARLVELGYWRREALTLDGYEITENVDLFPEDELSIYYYPNKWFFHEVPA